MTKTKTVRKVKAYGIIDSLTGSLLLFDGRLPICWRKGVAMGIREDWNPADVVKCTISYRLPVKRARK